MTHRLTSALGLMILPVALGCLGCGWMIKPSSDIAIDRFHLTINAVSHEAVTGDSQWQKICNLLNRYGPVDCDSFTKTNCRQIGSVRVCDYDNIVLNFDPPMTLEGIKRLHTELIGLEKSGVALGVQFAGLEAEYLGLTTEGAISIKVRIAVSPGATLYVERRWPGICEKIETRENVFHDEISLRKGQEWIYYRTELTTSQNLIDRFVRLNILTRQEEELTRDQFDRLIQRR